MRKPLLLVTIGLAAAAIAACGDNLHRTANDASVADASHIDAPAPNDGAVDAPPDAAPAITLVFTSPTAHQIVTGSRVLAVSGTITSSDTITAVTITGASSVTETTFDQTSFQATVTLGDNANTIVVTATGAGGETGSAQVVASFPFIALTTFEPATIALGQPDLVTTTQRTVDTASMAGPFGDPVELAGTLFVPSALDQRVVAYVGFPASNNRAMDFELGQPLTTTASGLSGRGGMAEPGTVATDGTHLVAVDHFNQRVLIWNTPPASSDTPADVVVGQPDFTTTTKGCTAAKLGAQPYDVALAGGKMIVSDEDNSRVLIWNTIPTTNGTPADLVLGQADFAHCAANDDNQDGVADAAPTARTFSAPSGAWSDGTHLVIVDQSNHRALVWNTFPTTSFAPADAVLGQADFTTATPATTAAGMHGPRMIDSNGNQLAICDEVNNRVLVWNTLPTTSGVLPDRVLGQADFTHGTANDDNQDGVTDATASARTLFHPRGVRFVRDTLIVADGLNARALVYGTPPCSANQQLVESPPGSGTCIADPCASTTCSGFSQCVHTAAGSAATCACQPGFTPDCTTCARRVTSTAAAGGDGTSWSDAASSVQAGIAEASVVVAALPAVTTCEVWIDDETFYVRQTANTDTITLADHESLFGGFAGDELTRGDRHGGATILDGLDGPGGSNAVLHVLTGTTGSAVLDSLTIQHGDAVNDSGGGVKFTGAQLVVSSCTFADNAATGAGGGLMANTTTGATTITNSAFTGNTAGSDGGGAHTKVATVTGSTFADNTAGGVGGGLLVLGANSTVASSTFTDNTADDSGGGADVAGANAIVLDDVVTGNRASFGGGLKVEDANGATLTNLLVAGNTSIGTGGGLAVISSTVTILGSTILGNVGATGGGAIRLSTSSLAMANSIVWGNAASGRAIIDGGGTQTYDACDLQSGAGTGSGLSVDPLFTSAPLFWDEVTTSTTSTITPSGVGGTVATGDTVVIGDDNVARTVIAVTAATFTFTPALAAAPAAGVSIADWGSAPSSIVLDAHLTAASPCIDAGDPTAGSATDLDGVSRVGAPDIGCYEYP